LKDGFTKELDARFTSLTSAKQDLEELLMNALGEEDLMLGCTNTYI